MSNRPIMFLCLCVTVITFTFCVLKGTQTPSKLHKPAFDHEREQIRPPTEQTTQRLKQNYSEEEEITSHRDFTNETRQSSIQAERQRILRQGCLKYPNLSQGNVSRKTMTHLLVNEKQKLLYCFIPKVGCSNWKRVMLKLAGKTKKKLLEITSTEAHTSRGLRTLACYNKEEQQTIWTSFTKFVYVRNPFVRILSAYKNKFQDIERYRKRTVFHPFGKKIIRKYRKNPSQKALNTGESVTWTEFVDYVTDPSGNPVEEHWEEINTICSPCKVKYDFLGHLETIETDAHFMLQTLNLSDQVKYPSAKRSHPTNSTASFEEMFKKLSSQQLERLWNIYKKDFELFGYPKPDFL